MKRVLVFVLALTLLFGTLAASAVPPGHANREMNRNQEELYGLFGMLPPGLIGKFIPPGLWKKGGLPPGLSGRADEELPPGIMMRFRQALQWENEWSPVKQGNTVTAGDYEELLASLKDKDEDIIIWLTEDIELEAPLFINGERRVRINGDTMTLTLDEDEFNVNNWMIIVEDGTELYMNDVKLDGALDDDALEGLVFVEEGGKLFTNNNVFSNAESAVGYEMKKADYDEDAEDKAEEITESLKDRNDFFPGIDYYLTIYDGNEILYRSAVE